MSQLRVSLLGYPTSALDGAPVPLRERKALALLAYLAMQEAPVSREALATLLWPDQPPPNAYANLRHALWALRRAGLGPWIAADRGTVAFLAGFELDVAAFTQALEVGRLEPAAALYGGDFLAGLTLSDAPAFDDWAFSEAERLRRLLAGALQQLAQSPDPDGSYEPAITYARRWLQLDPLHEPAHRQLMRLYARAGQRSAALRQYEACARLLEAELGGGPDEETRALYEAIQTRRLPAGTDPTASRAASEHEAKAVQPPPALSRSSGKPWSTGGALPLPSTPLMALRAEASSLIGRDTELAALGQLLADTPARLVTIVGVGGIGKTRLALAVAQRQAGAGAGSTGAAAARFPDGACLVELAPLHQPSLVGPLVLTALDLRGEAGRDPVAIVCDYLQGRRLLLVLDNCEHLAAACASFAEAVLRACPTVTILATSREPLGIAGETTWQVRPLAWPEDAGLDEPDTILRYEAVQLFLERARAVRADLSLTPESYRVIARICRELDGLPLAIELAAACVGALTVEQIAARLGDRFQLLTGGYRTALPRQQTLRAAIDWSYALIADPERTLLRRLAVFADGWTLAAAEGVCADPQLPRAAVLGALRQLVTTSLVVAGAPARGDPDQHRYRLLETIRQYGLERLAEAGEADWVQGRHLGYVGALAAEAAAGLCSAAQLDWLARLDTERANLRTAFLWALAGGPAQRVAALALAGALGAYWDLRGAYSEGRDWLEQARAATADLPGIAPAAQARALTALGVLASRQSDFAIAREHLEAGLVHWRASADQGGIGLAQAALGQVALFQGEYRLARALLEASTATLGAGEPRWGLADALRLLGMAAWELGEDAAARQQLEASVAHSRALGDRHTLANALNYLGELARSRGDAQGAAGLYQESLAVLEQLGNRALSAMVYGNLGQVARAQGEPQRAVESFLVCWEISIKRHGHKRFIVAVLAALAGAAHDLGRVELAARLCGAAAGYGGSLGAVLNRADRLTHERDLAAISARLGAARFADEHAAGQRLTPDQAIAVAAAELGSKQW